MSDRNLTVVLEALTAVAPDLEVGSISPTEDLQDDLGLDSMDSLNLVAAIHQRTGVDIPDRELPKLRCVADIVAYLDAAG